MAADRGGVEMNQSRLLMESDKGLPLEHHESNELVGNFAVVEQECEDSYSWFVAAIGFTIQFVAIGLLNNLGLWIQRLNIFFAGQTLVIGFVASIVYGCTFFFAPLSAILAENVGCRVLGILGALLCFVSCITTSFVTDARLLCLTMGLLMGVGNSFLFFGSLMVVPSFFKHHRSSANGIITCGSGFGSLVMAVILEAILQRYTWQRAMKITSLIYIGLIIPICFIFPRGIEFCPCSFMQNPFDRSRYSKLWHLMKVVGYRVRRMAGACICSNLSFTVFLVSCVTFMLGYLAPFLFLNSYATSLMTSKSTATSEAVAGTFNTTDNVELESSQFEKTLAASLIGIMCIFSSCTRVLAGVLAARFRLDVRKLIQGAFFFMGFAYIMMPFMEKISLIVIPVAIAGVAEGFYVSLTVSVVENVNSDINLNSAVGILYAIKAFPVAFSGYLLTYLYEVLQSYRAVFSISGSILILASLIMFLIYWIPRMPVDPLKKNHYDHSQNIDMHLERV